MISKKSLVAIHHISSTSFTHFAHLPTPSPSGKHQSVLQIYEFVFVFDLDSLGEYLSVIS